MKTKLFLIQFFLPILLFGQTVIQLSNVSNVCTNIEEYEIHTPYCIVIKPSLAQTDIAWLSYGNNSEPLSFSDTLYLDHTTVTTEQFQFYSLEVEKYFNLAFRLTQIDDNSMSGGIYYPIIKMPYMSLNKRI